MQNLRIFDCIVCLVALCTSSCAYDNEEDLFGESPCNGQQATYSQVIQPIITSKCAIPGCHEGSNASLPDWRVFNNVQSNAAAIKERTGNRTMPPSNAGVQLTASEINDIACWVDSGAQNN